VESELELELGIHECLSSVIVSCVCDVDKVCVFELLVMLSGCRAVRCPFYFVVVACMIAK
jgi:hypothetical protein